jgi:hypothetical protein
LGVNQLMGYFTQNDPRGEYWLYSEGNLRVNIGRGGISGVCHFNTSDVHLESGGPLGDSKVAEILAQLMVESGNDHGGYKQLTLHNDGKYDMSPEHVALIDRALSKIGFRLLNSSHKEIVWAKGA